MVAKLCDVCNSCINDNNSKQFKVKRKRMTIGEYGLFSTYDNIDICDKCFDKLLQIKDYKRIDNIMGDAVEYYYSKYETVYEQTAYLSAIDDIRSLMLKNKILKMRDNERH